MSDNQIKKPPRRYKCASCKTKFSSRTLLTDHTVVCEEIPRLCNIDGCKKRFKIHYLKIHQRLYHANSININIPPATPIVYYPQFVDTFKLLHHKVLRHALIIHQHMEYNICITVSVQRICTRPVKCLSSDYITVEDFVDIDDTIDTLIQLLTTQARKFYSRLSQIQVEKVEVNIKRFHPHTGSFIPVPNDIASIEGSMKNIEVDVTKIFSRKTSYMSLPNDVSNETVLINTRTYDQYCFKWSILCAVAKLCGSLEQANKNHPSVHFIDNIADDKIHCAGVDLDFTGLVFPCEIRHCREFETRNRMISVNIFGLERSESNGKWRVVGPLYRTRCEQKIHVNLLFLEDVSVELNKSHFVYINNLKRLLSKDDLSGENSDADANTILCNTCLRFFEEKYMFEEHKSDKKNCEKPLSFD